MTFMDGITTITAGLSHVVNRVTRERAQPFASRSNVFKSARRSKHRVRCSRDSRFHRGLIGHDERSIFDAAVAAISEPRRSRGRRIRH